jgi:adenylate cyclase
MGPDLHDHHHGLVPHWNRSVEAVRCAVAVQEALASQAAQGPSQTLQLRIRINLGDIIIEEDGPGFR